MRVLRRRFPILVGHAGETEAFRRRFQQVVSLLLLYRAVGTLAALAGFLSTADRLSPRPHLVVALSSSYMVLALLGAGVTAHTQLRFRGRSISLGGNQGWWLDRPAALAGDFALAIAVNLYAAAVFYPGRAYDQYTDVLAVGMITTVMLWTGRRGGRRGMAGLALALAVEVLKAPIGGIPLTEIDWAVVATRMLWVLAGVIVAVGVVRVLLDYAERAERLRLEDEMLDEARRSHDSYKAALRAITNILAERDGDRALDTVRQLAMDALDPAPAAEAGTVEDVIAAAARQGRAARPAMEFKLVDAARQEIHLTEPARLRHAIENLCVNAALHSRGSRTTIHWSLTPAGLEVSVRDDGIGMKSSGGAGIGLARRQVAAVGGDLYRREVHPGTNWIVRLPASAFKAG